MSFRKRYSPSRELQDAMREAAPLIAQALREGAERVQQAVSARLSAEWREEASKARYKARVAAERRLGLAHVRATAIRVRRELGLPDE